MLNQYPHSHDSAEFSDYGLQTNEDRRALENKRNKQVKIDKQRRKFGTAVVAATMATVALLGIAHAENDADNARSHRIVSYETKFLGEMREVQPEHRGDGFGDIVEENTEVISKDKTVSQATAVKQATIALEALNASQLEDGVVQRHETFDMPQIAEVTPVYEDQIKAE